MAVEGGDARSPDVPIGRFLVRWGIVVGVLFGLFVGTIVILNSTLYSAEGFVRSYLGAIERRDVAAALRTPGVDVGDDAATELLVPDALGDVGGVRVLSDTITTAGEHDVEVELELSGERATSVFTVERAGTRFGVFNRWTFVVSPTATLEITPEQVSTFTVNERAVTTENEPGTPARYTVLAPGEFTLGHASTYLVADPEDILVLQPGSSAAARIPVRANDDFVAMIQTQLDDLLDDCATQKVLQPTGCPFGETVRNRIVTEPQWSIARYPEVRIQPGPTADTWRVPAVEGAAHLEVDVRSLFDGTISTIDEDVTFSVGYLITLGDNDQVSIVAE
ncbi:hypothetical protein [Marisediminicola senii]|uniref:hypothetical protein n=1 Tax=Marisediminicola senii TaxID=2711233 RepID=UPI0013EA3C18|nr:hypothetical protein [Marisediminicola senii]